MKELLLKDRTITTELDAFIMGIVNCTPDSFFSGSRYSPSSIDSIMNLVDEGADILDIGGESTRPGSENVSEEEEMERVIPVIREIRKRSNVAISVDTRKASVMKEALNAGADIANDISALEDDPLMAPLCAEEGIPVILMHKRGIPSTMQKDTAYEKDIFDEVNEYLLSRIEFAQKAGIKKEKIIVDPGIGFGKNLNDNITLVKKVGQLCNGEVNILMALSRKSFLGEITGRPVEQRLSATLTASLISVMNGADIVRVHDVSSCLDSLAVLQSLK